MDKLYLAAVTIFGIGWYIEQRILYCSFLGFQNHHESISTNRICKVKNHCK